MNWYNNRLLALLRLFFHAANKINVLKLLGFWIYSGEGGDT
jgi:hypothetical protein